jgi:hypothetical protein
MKALDLLNLRINKEKKVLLEYSDAQVIGSESIMHFLKKFKQEAKVINLRLDLIKHLFLQFFIVFRLSYNLIQFIKRIGSLDEIFWLRNASFKLRIDSIFFRRWLCWFLNSLFEIRKRSTDLSDCTSLVRWMIDGRISWLFLKLNQVLTFFINFGKFSTMFLGWFLTMIHMHFILFGKSLRDRFAVSLINIWFNHCQTDIR